MRLAGREWYSLDSAEATEYAETLREVPGAKVSFALGGRQVVGAELHRSHLPLCSLPPLPAPEGPGFRPVALASPTEAQAPLYPLRDYQTEGVNFVRERSGALLLHDLGLGKTPIALRAAGAPALVVCPTSAVGVWLREARLHGAKAKVLHGLSSSVDEASGADIYITTYGSAGAWFARFRGGRIHTVIADEAHVMQKRALQWSQAFRSILRQRTILLTATPLRNRLRSLWALLDAASPRAWGSEYDFRRHYCGTTVGRYGLVDGEPSNLDELALRLSAVAIRETWANPAFDGLRPRLERVSVDVELSPEARQDLVTLTATEVFQKFKDAGTTSRHLPMLTGQRHRLGLAKAEWAVADWLPSIVERHRRVLVWTWYQDVARAVAKALVARLGDTVPVTVLTGESDIESRADDIAAWSDPDARAPGVLVATLAAMGASVNLTSVEAAVFLEYDWAPLVMNQAEARHHRVGNTRDVVYAYYLRAPGTIEERLVQVLREKLEESLLVVGEHSQLGQMEALLGTGMELQATDDGDVMNEAVSRIVAEARG